MPLPRTIPESGVEVVIMDNAIMVGDQFETMDAAAEVETLGSVIEFRRTILYNERAKVVPYRLPLAEEAYAQAHKATQRYGRSPAAAITRPLAKLWIAAGIAAFLIVFTVAGVLLN